MANDLRASRFIVTGAASGIGDAVARQLIDAGAHVVSLDRNDPTADVEHIRIDLADVSSIDDAVGQLTGEWTGLINVAGVPGTAPAETVFAVNFLGLRHLTDAVAPSISRSGSVVNIASTAGFRWTAHRAALTELLGTESFAAGAQWFADNPQEVSAYALSKEAVILYTLSQAIDYAKRGLRINAVLPGPVDTPILSDFETSMGKSLLDGVKSLLGRHAAAEEIASAAVFLASPQSSWVNGQQIAVDGGILAGWASGALAPPTSASTNQGD